MKIKLTFSPQTFILLFTFLFMLSCVPARKLKYFNDINQIEEPVANPREQKLIMPFDNLYIKIFSIDEKTSKIFNSSDDMRNSLSTNMISYVVDENGNINFPFVGNINVGSLTTAQAGTKIQTALNDYMSSTSVLVRFIDNKITVMGEVQTQGIHSFTQDKLTVYEAISLGGGITHYGDRKNVILIRQERDKVMHYKLDLTDSKIAGRNYYFVLPNDVIVVEPLNAAAWGFNNNNSFSTAMSAVSTLMTTITTLVALKITFFK